MLSDVLREAFRLANRRLHLFFFDVIWKAIWFMLTVALLLLVAVWFGSRIQAITWMDTGNRSVNTAVAFALLRQFWVLYRAQMFGAIAAVLFLSLFVWFLLEAAVRAHFPLPLGESRVRVSGLGKSGDPHPTLSQRERVQPRFNTFLFSNVLKCLVITSTIVVLAAICFSRYFVTPPSEWRQLWPDTRGGVLVAIVIIAGLGLLLAILETLIRSDAIELFGTDLFRVTGLIGILLLFEAMISGSCAVIIAMGFLNIEGWKTALLVLGAAAVAIVFLNVLHSYLLLVRFSAVGIMRQNVVEI